MEATATWPSLVVEARRRAEADRKGHGCSCSCSGIDPSNSEDLELPNNTMLQPSELYFRLSQLLEGEIWHHNQTRTTLYAEMANREELERHNQMQAHTLSQWEQTYETVCASLDEHRMESAQLKQELEGVNAELVRLKQKLSNVSPPIVRSEVKMTEVGDDAGEGIEGGVEIEGTWQKDFLRDIQEHMKLYE